MSKTNVASKQNWTELFKSLLPPNHAEFRLSLKTESEEVSTITAEILAIKITEVICGLIEGDYEEIFKAQGVENARYAGPSAATVLLQAINVTPESGQDIAEAAARTVVNNATNGYSDAFIEDACARIIVYIRQTGVIESLINDCPVEHRGPNGAHAALSRVKIITKSLGAQYKS
ncbi:hypothetical protein KKA15_01635 [Patescibacteria group bacterium]|nr:hypothetical protein [Patescibacteria group bacterium]